MLWDATTRIGLDAAAATERPPPPVSLMVRPLEKTALSWNFAVVTLCAQLTRDLLAIVNVLVFIGFRGWSPPLITCSASRNARDGQTNRDRTWIKCPDDIVKADCNDCTSCITICCGCCCSRGTRTSLSKQVSISIQSLWLFLLHDAMHSADYAGARCISVCLSAYRNENMKMVMTNNFNKVETALTVSCPITWILLKITKYYINYRVDHKNIPNFAMTLNGSTIEFKQKEAA